MLLQILLGNKLYDVVLQVTSPSGRAVFKVDFTAAGAHSFVDVLVCREPEPANLPLSDGTVTCYRNGTFIWWASPNTPTTSYGVFRTAGHRLPLLYVVAMRCHSIMLCAGCQLIHP